jgi:hypothetical protein
VKHFLFTRNHFVLDLLASLSFGGYLGYSIRVESDSGIEYHPDLYFKAAIVCGFAMLIAVVISSLLQAKLRLFPSFLVLAVLGPLFFGIGYRGMMFFEWLNSMPYSGKALTEEIGAVLTGALFFLIPFALYLFAVRLFVYFVTAWLRTIRTTARLP